MVSRYHMRSLVRVCQTTVLTYGHRAFLLFVVELSQQLVNGCLERHVGLLIHGAAPVLVVTRLSGSFTWK
jgi:hypothetical protein